MCVPLQYGKKYTILSRMEAILVIQCFFSNTFDLALRYLCCVQFSVLSILFQYCSVFQIDVIFFKASKSVLEDSPSRTPIKLQSLHRQ